MLYGGCNFILINFDTWFTFLLSSIRWMCFYGNYEEDKATKFQLMRKINLQGAISCLQLRSDAVTKAMEIAWNGVWNSLNARRKLGGSAPVRAHVTLTNLQLQLRRSKRHLEQDGAFSSWSQSDRYCAHGLLFLEGKSGDLFFFNYFFFNGASIRTELPFPRPKIWVAFFRTDLT